MVYDVVGERYIGTSISDRKRIPDIVPTSQGFIEIPLIADGFLKLGYMQKKDGGKIENISIGQIKYPNSKGEEYTSPFFSFGGYDGPEGLLNPITSAEKNELNWALAEFNPHKDIDFALIDWHNDVEMQVVQAFGIQTKEFAYTEEIKQTSSSEVKAIIQTEDPNNLLNVFDQDELQKTFGENHQQKTFAFLASLGPISAPLSSSALNFASIFFEYIEGERLEVAPEKVRNFTFSDLDPEVQEKVIGWLEFGRRHDLLRTLTTFSGKRYMSNPYVANKLNSFGDLPGE